MHGLDHGLRLRAAAHVGLVRASMLQGGGRARSILDTGKPVFFISDEPVAGALVDDTVDTSTWADREAVEAVRAVRDGEAGTSLFPIEDRYRKKSGISLPKESTLAAL